MIRVRISWMRSNIAASPEYADGSIPYRFNAVGVLPPLWSSAAMNPWAVCILRSMSASTTASRLTDGRAQPSPAPSLPPGTAGRRPVSCPAWLKNP